MNIGNLAQKSETQKKRPKVVAESKTRIVPFDYVVTVPIIGKPNNLAQNVINISVEGYFVATAISYSLLVDERETPKDFGALDTKDPQGIRGPISPNAIPLADPIEGTQSIKLIGEPHAEVLIVKNNDILSSATPFILDENGRLVDTAFTFVLGDTIIIRDITNNLSSPVIHVGTESLTPITPQFGPQKPTAGGSKFDIVGTPGAEVDILRLKRGSTVLDELKVGKSIPDTDEPGKEEKGLLIIDIASDNIVELGDTILVRNTDNNLSSVFQVPDNVLDFKLSNIPVKFLRQGFRVNPTVLNRIENGVPISSDELEAAFQPCGVLPGDLSFLYSIIDNGTGRELQSEPIHNIAGLGIANGDRPFRPFPKPLVFEPRSVILFQVQEIFGGPGTLYFVLQGYKVLGTGALRMEG